MIHYNSGNLVQFKLCISWDSCLANRFFTAWATREVYYYCKQVYKWMTIQTDLCALVNYFFRTIFIGVELMGQIVGTFLRLLIHAAHMPQEKLNNLYFHQYSWKTFPCTLCNYYYSKSHVTSSCSKQRGSPRKHSESQHLTNYHSIGSEETVGWLMKTYMLCHHSLSSTKMFKITPYHTIPLYPSLLLSTQDFPSLKPSADVAQRACLTAGRCPQNRTSPFIFWKNICPPKSQCLKFYHHGTH